MRKRSTRVAVSRHGLILKIRRLERKIEVILIEKLRSDRNCFLFLFLRSGVL
jgi:hypothetical protein